MTESIYSDPAAPPRGGVRFSAPADSAPREPLVSKVARRWWLAAICVALAIAAAFAYLAVATKTYTSRSVLVAEIERGTAAGDVAPDDFLFRQRDLINSPPVLAAAATSLITSDARVREALEVTVAKGEGVVTIAYSAPGADEAARGANAVAEAYLRARNQQQTQAVAGLSDLTKQRDQLTADRTRAEAELRKLRDAAGAAGSDAERAAAARVEQLQQAVTAAEVDAAASGAAVAAAKDLLADPVKLRAVVEANRGKPVFDRLESQRTPVEAELAKLAPQLERQRQAMLPQHPVVIATQQKIEQLRAKLAELDAQYAGVYAAHLEQQHATARKRVEQIKQLVAEQSAQAKEFTARAARLAETEGGLKKIEASIAAVDQKIRDVTLGPGAPVAPTVKVVAPAQPPRHARHPPRDRTVGIAAAVGLIAGIALAALIPGRHAA